MREIGGYFELELPKSNWQYIHSSALHLNSGRNALEYILLSLHKQVKRMWVPYYTCDVILQPIEKLGLDYKFYHINTHLEIDEIPNLQKDDYILLNNYFGIKDEYIAQMADTYPQNIIIDNTQAWYAEAIDGVNSFYSPRKFFGVPDGGIAYCSDSLKLALDTQETYEWCSHLLKRIDVDARAGYNDFRSNALQFNNAPLKYMSRLSQKILSTINFDYIKQVRCNNFNFLHDRLRETNMLNIPSAGSFRAPMVYPYLTDNPALRQTLIDNKIYVAQYWPNVLTWCKNDDIEYTLAKNIIPLPIDQRYNINDMAYIADTL
ncbi:MAG: hypothetical protein NC217_06790 [Muribaculaceae bacterium]|nr:hypothetical protein [Muribaculaceae bacterium]